MAGGDGTPVHAGALGAPGPPGGLPSRAGTIGASGPANDIPAGAGSVGAREPPGGLPSRAGTIGASGPANDIPAGAGSVGVDGGAARKSALVGSAYPSGTPGRLPPCAGTMGASGGSVGKSACVPAAPVPCVGAVPPQRLRQAVGSRRPSCGGALPSPLAGAAALAGGPTSGTACRPDRGSAGSPDAGSGTCHRPGPTTGRCMPSGSCWRWRPNWSSSAPPPGQRNVPPPPPPPGSERGGSSAWCRASGWCSVSRSPACWRPLAAAGLPLTRWLAAGMSPRYRAWVGYSLPAPSVDRERSTASSAGDAPCDRGASAGPGAPGRVTKSR